MSNFGRRIEILSNIAIIVVAVLLSFTLLKNYFQSRESTTSSSSDTAKATLPPSRPKSSDLIGRMLSIPGVSWSKNNCTLLLAIQSKCRFCSESAPFYRQLGKENNRAGFQFAVISSESVEATKTYLTSLDVIADQISQVQLDSIGVLGTPAILLVDNTGVITKVWLGRLDSNGETEVLNQLRKGIL